MNTHEQNKHLNIKIYGKVQGVFFRASAREKAFELGVNGFVRNEDDGSVYIEAEGHLRDIRKFLEWIKEGPRWASVERVETEEGEEVEYKTFSIK